MSNGINGENLSDEDFLSHLDSLIEEADTEPEIEETEQDFEDYSDTENDEEILDNSTETADEEFEDDSENAQIEDDVTEEDGNEGAEDNVEAEDNADDKSDEVNYKEQYEQLLKETEPLKNFYNEVTGEFTANGVKVKGFTDPKKVIQAQQMAANYAANMAELKPYKGFIKTLKNKGLVEDKDKFNFALQLLEGDQEALKKHIKELDIDPFSMDLEDIQYKPKDHLPSPVEMNLEEVIDYAKVHGADERVSEVISKEWDDDSVLELINNKQVSRDLVEHIKTGTYDIVKARMEQKKAVDFEQTYSAYSSIDQYKIALQELEAEYAQQQAIQAQQYQQPIAQERTWSLPKNIVEDYSKKVGAVNKEVEAARRKAASVSKRKKVTSRAKPKIDPLKDLDNDAFAKFIDSLA